MVPDKFNMVDMGGIDLLASNGQVVDGLYNRLEAAYSPCRICVLYNYSFGTLIITPQYAFITQAENEIILNGAIHVTNEDVVMLPTISASDYNELTNKPKINNVELSGNLSIADLGIDYPALSGKPSINNVELVGNLSLSDLNIPSIAAVELTLSSSVTFTGSSLRIGNCVIISGRFDFNSGTGWRTLATVPLSVVPGSDVGFMAGHGGSIAVRDGNCSTTGAIQIYTESSDRYLYFTLIYLLS